MCLVSYRPKIGKRRGALGYERFRQIVDELPQLERLTLQGLGEPLLAPRLIDMVAYAAARGIAARNTCASSSLNGCGSSGSSTISGARWFTSSSVTRG